MRSSIHVAAATAAFLLCSASAIAAPARFRWDHGVTTLLGFPAGAINSTRSGSTTAA